MNPEEFARLLQGARQEVGKVIVGQQDIIDTVLMATLAEGHVLLEGVPGLGKTRLLATLGKVLDVAF